MNVGSQYDRDVLDTLENLAKSTEVLNKNVDSWGNGIKYTVDSNTKVLSTLSEVRNKLAKQENEVNLLKNSFEKKTAEWDSWMYRPIRTLVQIAKSDIFTTATVIAVALSGLNSLVNIIVTLK